MHSLPVLDGYRGIAASMVVATHVAFSTGFVLTAPVGPVTARFDIGVAIFFLLSGFLLYRPWSLAGMKGQRRPSTLVYLRRRCWRLLPAYWVMAITVLLVLPTITPTFQQILANLTLVQVYGTGLHVRGMTQAWSISVELAFYLALPAIGWFANRRWRGNVERSFRWQLILIAALWTTGVVFTLLRTVGPLRDALSVGFWLPSFLDWFALGMAAGLVHARLQLPNPPKLATRISTLGNETTTCLVLAAAGFLIVCTPLAGSYTLLSPDKLGVAVRHLTYPLVAMAFLLPGFFGLRHDGLFHRFLTHPGMQFLGAVSYSLFLWHVFVRDSLAYYVGIEDFSGGFAWMFPLTFLISLILAWLSWVAIERPALAWSHGDSLRQRLAARRSRRTVVSGEPAEATKPSDAVTSTASLTETHTG